MNKVFCGACGIEINSYGHICEPMNSDYASFDRKLLLEIHSMLTDLVATDQDTNTDVSNPQSGASLNNIEDDIMYKIQDIITNHIVMSGDPLFNLATNLNQLIKDEVIKELKKTSDTFDDLHQGTPGAGYVHYGEFGEYLDDRIKELQNE